MDTLYEKTLDWIHGTARFGSKLGLERILRLLTILGNPQNRVKFLHVAGTNGKGSVTAMLASALHTAGYRTGMFISPYLEDFRERISLNGMMIEKKALIRVGQAVKSAVEQAINEGSDQPTEFEIVTTAAFLYYAQEVCDYAVMEVGLGGRFDATNVITPLVSVITTISHDHTDRLGDTLGKIAFEKAGIIKPGVPVVTGVTEPEPFDVIKTIAKEKGCSLTTVGEVGSGTDVTWCEVSRFVDGQVIDVVGPGFEHRGLRVPLLGKHQQQNAAIAVATLETAMALPESPIYIDRMAIAAGIAKTVWPSRLEVLSKKPLVILDGAHNPAGAKALSEAMKDIPRKNLICVYGILEDKSYTEATAHIAPICEKVILTKPATPRALDPAILKLEVEKHMSRNSRSGVKEIFVEPDMQKAFNLALSKADTDDAILCCGSLYLVGPLRTHIRKHLGVM
ncbi:MAG: bifunctional folylpolyglutamate synthase/dihydrofolate synthase [Bacillota bacterium]